MHPVAILRVFQRRNENEGPIGECRLTGEAKLSLDGKELPGVSVEYLMNFALQSLQDAYAGKESADDARAAWTAKRDALLAGTIGTRGTGASVAPETRIAREIMRDIFHKKADAKAKAAYKAADADGRAAILDAAIAKNADAIGKLVAEEMKRRAKVGNMEMEI